MAKTASNATPTGKPDPGSSSQAGDEAPGAGGRTVAEILAEFDKADPPPPSGDDKGKETPDNSAEISSLRAEVADLRMENEMPGIVSTVKGETSVPDDAVKSWVMGKFVSDEKMMNLWATRHDNATTFKDTLKALGEELKEAFPQKDPDKPDAQSTLAAAVRSARTGQPALHDGGQDWSGMSDQQFALESHKVLLAAEAGTLTAT